MRIQGVKKDAEGDKKMLLIDDGEHTLEMDLITGEITITTKGAGQDEKRK